MGKLNHFDKAIQSIQVSCDMITKPNLENVSCLLYRSEKYCQICKSAGKIKQAIDWIHNILFRILVDWKFNWIWEKPFYENIFLLIDCYFDLQLVQDSSSFSILSGKLKSHIHCYTEFCIVEDHVLSQQYGIHVNGNRVPEFKKYIASIWKSNKHPWFIVKAIRLNWEASQISLELQKDLLELIEELKNLKEDKHILAEAYFWLAVFQYAQQQKTCGHFFNLSLHIWSQLLPNGSLGSIYEVSCWIQTYRYIEIMVDHFNAMGDFSNEIIGCKLLIRLNDLLKDFIISDGGDKDLYHLGPIKHLILISEAHLELGYIGKSGAALEKAKQYINENNSVKWKLAYCLYLCHNGKNTEAEELFNSISDWQLQSKTDSLHLLAKAYYIRAYLSLSLGILGAAVTESQKCFSFLQKLSIHLLDNEVDKIAEKMDSSLLISKKKELWNSSNGLFTPTKSRPVQKKKNGITKTHLSSSKIRILQVKYEIILVFFGGTRTNGENVNVARNSS